MIESFSIENFRGITRLEINNLKKINILTGKNNCGKTTILEALFLLIGMSNPQLSLNIHNFRDLTLTIDEDFRFLFHKLTFDKHPEISGRFQGHKRSLRLEPLFLHYLNKSAEKEGEDKYIVRDPGYQSSTSNADIIEGLKLTAMKNNKEVCSSEISIKHHVQKIDRKYKEELQGRFLNPNTMFLNLDKNLESILVKKEIDKIIHAIQAVEPAIIDIRIGTGGMIYADVGFETLIPINLLGDGIRRILSIITAITEHKNSIILIDEIENGLHYSALGSLWKAILTTMTENNIQLFVATHSFECIHAFIQTVRETAFNKDDITLFRIERKENKFKALKYDAEMLEDATENDIEVR